MNQTQKIFRDSILWVRIAICANTHIKNALLNVVHNRINHPQVRGIPSDSKDLYAFLQTKGNIIKNAKHLKNDQKSILLSASSRSIDSSLLDISLIRWLIQTFCNIKNANGNWQEPLQTDQTICANVYRAAIIRNRIFHYNDVKTLDEPMFETIWKEMKDILKGLNYTEDIEPMRTETLDITKIQGEMLKEFRDHLEDYKNETSKETLQEVYVERRFSDKKTNDIVTEIDTLIKESDQVNIFANAGVGKSVTARNIRYEWAKDKILNDFFLLYFDSTQINQTIRYNSFSAPLFFSDLGCHLRKKGKTEQDFKYFNCVRKTIDNFIILIDGIDEFPIRNFVTGNYVNQLENKVKNNEEITAADTLIAIYFGFLFPHSKICLLGRIGEFEQLKKVNSPNHQTIFNDRNRIIKKLELLKFDDENVKDFTCNKFCKQPIQITICRDKCQEFYEKIKNIELCKNPTDLNSLLELHKKHPNESIGKITRTKLIFATLLNRLTNHIKQKNNFIFKTFREINEQKDYSKYLECIRSLGKMSFKTLLEGNVTIQVNEKRDSNGIVYFEDENQISIERKILEELDLFYIRDFDYYLILEPHHTLNIEFLSACHFFSHRDKWDSILELNTNRQLEIIKFISGLYANDYFTKDFVENVLDTSGYSLEVFFSWLYNTEDLRGRLPDGGFSYNCWFGLMENQKLSPSFFLLNSISYEVEIPQTFIPKTIVCYCDHIYGSSFEWFYMEYFNHTFLTKLSDKLNIESFLMKFPNFKFIIKGNIKIYNNHKFNRLYLHNNNIEFKRLDQCNRNNQITFKINGLHIFTSLDASFSPYFNFNALYIGGKCDSRTIDMILNALSPPATNISTIQCKRLRIYDNISRLDGQQTEKLFKLCLSGVLDYIPLAFTFFTENQINILKNVECNHKRKIINIQLSHLKFNRVFRLPNLCNRHVSLYYVKSVTDNDVIKFRRHIPLGYSYNLCKYKIIDYNGPFVPKKNHSQKYEQSMFLHLYSVDFRQVSPDVFANTFSLIPSLSCGDDELFDRGYIPSSHWLSLSKAEDCRIKEIRIWEPQSKNFEYFLNIKTNNIQFVCSGKDKLIHLLNYIVNDSSQLGKGMKIFVVKYDKCNWDYYEEITLFSGKTIEEFKKEYELNELLLDNISVPFHDGEQHLNHWCCEISLLFEEVTDLNTERTSNSNECFIEEKKVLVESENQTDANLSDNKGSVEEKEDVDNEMKDENENYKIKDQGKNNCFLKRCCCCF